MGKLKTRKTISKRFKVKKSGKILMRTCGQGHFNSREKGKKTRNKRRDHVTSVTNARVIKAAVGKG